MNDGALGEERTDVVLKQAPDVRHCVSGGRRQAAELPVLDEDVEEAEADEVDAAGFASDVEDDVDEDDGVEDFDAAGELLDDEPRLSFR